MKHAAILLLAVAALTLATPARADDRPPLAPGTRLKLQTVQPLPDDPAEVTVVQSAGDWLLVEYTRTYTVRGESGSKTEKAQLWVNLDHVVSARVLQAK